MESKVITIEGVALEVFYTYESPDDSVGYYGGYEIKKIQLVDKLADIHNLLANPLSLEQIIKEICD